jgi:hypothetical protein
VVIHRLEQLQMLRQAALPRRLSIYLKLNSGMNRLGLTGDQLPAVRRELAAMASTVGTVTLMTHFAEADAAGGEACIAWQVERFARMTADWPAAASFPVSMANSAAILRYPQTAHAWVRPGIMLYGGSPFADQDAASLDLKPVMTLRSRILAVQEIGVGERVGYGGTFVAPADAGRRRRLRLCRRLPAARAGRHADRRRRPAHADPGAGVDGHAGLRPDRPADAGVDSPVVLWGEGLPADEVASAAGNHQLRAVLRPGAACAGGRSLSMARPGAARKTVFSCTECGASAAKWQGQCPGCGVWNTLVETIAEAAAGRQQRRFAALGGRPDCRRSRPSKRAKKTACRPASASSIVRWAAGWSAAAWC